MNIFEKITKPRIKKNAFDLSHERKMSFDATEIIPILCEEVVPSDKFSVNTELFMRLAPMVAPVMHRMNVFVDFFYVPNRILWRGWERFIAGAGRTGTSLANMGVYDGTNLSLPIYPYTQSRMTVDNIDYSAVGTLADYLGLPVAPNITADNEATRAIYVNVLPFVAYQTIYWEYYRHEYLQSDANGIESEYGYLRQVLDSFKNNEVLSMSGIPSNFLKAILTLRNHNWESDYFTSALPYTQLGTPITFGSTSQTEAEVQLKQGNTDAGKWTNRPQLTDSTDEESQAYNPNGTLEAIGENYSSFNVNDLRKAFQVQRWMERNFRGGIRYIEQLFSHFGVRSSNKTLQRPQYLGGGRAPVVISEVLQTAGNGGSTNPQLGVGNMAGHGYASSGKWKFSKYFEEHGYVIGLMSVMPRTSYQQGMQRTFMRRDQLDFYFPEFAHLGEQKVNNGELYYTDATTNMSAFGYTPRYQEYRERQSTVHGHFKSDSETSVYNDLTKWHLGRVFSSAPALNDTFIKATPDITDRIFQFGTASGDDHLIAQIINHVTAIRPMPRFGTPGLVDHFGGK